MSKFDKVLGEIATAANLVGQMFTYVMMLIVVIDVVALYFFLKAVPGSVELPEIFMAMLVFLGLAFTHRTGVSIRVELLRRRLPPKGRFSSDLLANLCGFVLFALMTWRTGVWFVTNVTNRTVVGASLNAPAGPLFWAIPFGCLLITIECLTRMIMLARAGVQQ
jgi:TRAP-type C4-dicarboxylate transport system permease small subunit